MMFDLTHCHLSQLDSPAKVGGEFGRSLVPLSLGDFSAVVQAGDRQRGMGKNVGGVPAHQYVNQVKFVERYGTKMSGSSHVRLLVSIFFIIFRIIYIYSNLYLCIYTPSYPHFKAFPVSKFNLETSFLYQLFKENSNIIVLKPCKLINEAIF